ncbi:DUF3883 domain-containing protein [Peribacillus simplex]|uniref:DUF3883 domain-containing protein n=1 Tax=Peribacillus simplex TaxID=1478 RepID=UPI00192293A6|nr:DUF3883 domain-containing protein [Peribacillus simplex]MBD8590397.1 DUF3883 domain-containing protein [Peribacillus simplex]
MDYKTHFIKWLKESDKKKEQTISKYVRNIEKISKELGEFQQKQINIYHISNSSEIEKIKKDYLSIGKFKEKDLKNHREYSSALSKYKVFLEKSEILLSSNAEFQVDILDTKEINEDDNEYKLGRIIREVEAPSTAGVSKNLTTGKETLRTPKRNDYVKQQKKNSKIGFIGEQLILIKEMEMLRKAGMHVLADKVDHVSITKGDGMGFDIKSFTIEGEEKYIEVKTTTGGINTPFYIEESEVTFSRDNASKYYLVRVFNYDKDTGNAELFIKKGDVEKNFLLQPKTYIAK